MQEKRKKELVGSSVIAEYFGMSARNVQLLAKSGVIPAHKVGNYYKYDFDETVKTYIRYLSDKINGREAARKGTARERKEEAEADLKRSKADIAALQLKELEGRMHRSEDVEAVMTDLIFAIRSRLLAVPGRLAVETADAQTAAETVVIIRKEIYDVLEELTKYRYDPEEYAKRVREREGWLSVETDDEE